MRPQHHEIQSDISPGPSRDTRTVEGSMQEDAFNNPAIVWGCSSWLSRCTGEQLREVSLGINAAAASGH